MGAASTRHVVLPSSVAQDLLARRGEKQRTFKLNGTGENHWLPVIKGKHVIYKGIDVSTGEVVSKFYEGIASELYPYSVYGIALNV